MSTKVETFVQIKDSRWLTALPGVEGLCQQAAAAAWHATLSEEDTYEATIVLADDNFIAQLNHDFRQQNKPTNVLSFPTDEAARLVPEGVKETPSLGDVVIAFETTQSEAPDDLADHLGHLVVHGCLHLLGYDHEADGEAANMETLEIKILAGLGITDPYLEITNN
ncbi:MAG: rRNA maturation RNase YbeY [Rhodospirillaceae bacterium]|jgi:probable rRNA maturation factor|nr:rRNA maturation RNase YbeY [Rhodospirillaceae bacterium]MBT5939114.1 rRNA maturation RNase YbeY [Rhodospirillaceae bacterium]MBT7954757.1 rRNA maturation RNase YbeY [Rhodospirillaceae bacterium]